MEYRALGHTGLSVSAIALGCEGFTDKTPEAVRKDFDCAQDLGINFFDCYSSNPQLRSAFGEAMRGRREKFIVQGHICSAWENGQYLRTRDPVRMERAFRDLLTRLGTDYIDVGMIHYIDAEEDFRAVFDGEIIQYAQRLKEKGRIRFLGLSSHNPHVASLAVGTGLIDVLLFAVNPCYDMQPAGENVEDLWADESYMKDLHNMDPERESLYELCARRGVGIDVMKTYGGGDLLSERNSPFGRAFTPVQCIEYALTRPAVAAVMIGCRTQAEIRAAVDWCAATPQQRDYVPVMQGMKRFSWQGHCMYCGHCAPCPQGINVASVNKFLNLAKAQKQIPETVREHYALLPHHACECIACGSCEKRCPFGVPVIGAMKEAFSLFGC